MYQYTFQSRYAYGDRLEFDSKGRKGVGVVVGISVSDDMSVDYILQLQDGDCLGGIYPDEIVNKC